MKGRLVECLETVLNKAQEPPKSKKVQHSNAKNAILFETISLIIHYDRCTARGWDRGWGPTPGLREERLGLESRSEGGGAGAGLLDPRRAGLGILTCRQEDDDRV